MLSRLPDRLRGIEPARIPGERRGLVLIYLILSLATGLAFYLAWLWQPGMSFAANTRWADGKIAVDCFLALLLVFAARRQVVLSDPSVFD